MTWTLILVFLSGILAGFMNVLAGGGSFLTIPALYLTGLPVDVANATNRVAVLFQCLAAVVEFKRKGVLRLKEIFPFLGPALIGSLIGSFIMISIDKKTLQIIIALMIFAIGGLVALKPDLGQVKRDTKLPKWIGWLSFFLIGIYGGFLQAGVGFFLIFALVTIGGFDLLTTNAIKMAIVLSYMVISVALFWAYGIIELWPAVILSAGNVLGAYIGTHTAISKGNRFLRLALLIMIAVSATKMLMDVVV
ncbi:MAG: TSUP family transporter [Synergistetes bacterium]|nr:TSUP family transporter [Synergistota bacterium]MDW8191715.1 TSUP family transporter [Synergistota bacterium]